MSHSRNHPTPEEWLKRKDEIEQLYLIQNMTLDDVRVHFDKQNFVATQRQYKTKLKAWNFDTKKIRGDVWKAMSVVSSQYPGYGRSITFYVPYRGGSERVVTIDAIAKQMKRNNVPDQDLSEAQHILNQNNIKLSGAPQQSVQQYSNYHNSYISADHYDSSPITSPPISSIHESLEDDRKSDCTIYSSPTSFGTITAQVRQPLPSNSYSFGTMQTDINWKDPIPGLDTDKNLLTSSMVAHSHSIQARDDFDLTSALGQLSIDPYCDESTRVNLKQILGQSYFPSRAEPLDEEKKLAAQWALHYLLSGLPQYNQQACNSHGDRQAAKFAFQVMMTRHNRYIFPYCNWILTVLASHDSSDSVREFLSDCCHVIDDSANGTPNNYASPFHFALALYTDNQQGIMYHGPEFEQSTRNIKLIWGRDSPNYLVNRIHLGWHKLDQNFVRDAIDIIESCLQDAKRMMGPRHIITINCLSIMSRAYSEIGVTHQAINYVEDALHRLDTTEVLQAFRFRLLRRLAMLLRQKGDLGSAEHHLINVADYQIAHFGLKSDTTWVAIDQLLDILRIRGRKLDAEHFEKVMNDGFQQQSQENWSRNSQTPMSWKCRICHKIRNLPICCPTVSPGMSLSSTSRSSSSSR